MLQLHANHFVRESRDTSRLRPRNMHGSISLQAPNGGKQRVRRLYWMYWMAVRGQKERFNAMTHTHCVQLSGPGSSGGVTRIHPVSAAAAAFRICRFCRRACVSASSLNLSSDWCELVLAFRPRTQKKKRRKVLRVGIESIIC